MKSIMKIISETGAIIIVNAALEIKKFMSVLKILKFAGSLLFIRLKSIKASGFGFIQKIIRMLDYGIVATKNCGYQKNFLRNILLIDLLLIYKLTSEES